MSEEKRTIGFDRKIQLDWLDATAGRLAQGQSPGEIRAHLDRLLEGQVAGNAPRGAAHKTKTVLLHIWVLVPESLRPLRDEGLALFQEQPRPVRLALHWGMCLATYPFFHDVAATTGRLLTVQGTAALSQVKRRIMEGWGQRSTVIRATQRLVRCFVDWGVLRETDEPGVFHSPPKIGLDDSKAVGTWLIEAYLSSRGSEMIPFRQLLTRPALFPFSLSLSLQDIVQNPRLELFRHGLDEDVVTRRSP